MSHLLQELLKLLKPLKKLLDNYFIVIYKIKSTIYIKSNKK